MKLLQLVLTFITKKNEITFSWNCDEISCKHDGVLLVTRSPSDGIPRGIRLLEVVLDEAVGRVFTI